MITVCIRYTIDIRKTREFEEYARRWPAPIKRCGGELVGYFLPTKYAGATNEAIAMIDFADLAAYEKYRQALAEDAEACANVGKADDCGCILVEERSILRPIYPSK